MILTALDCLRLVLQKTSVRKEAVVTDLITQLCAKATGLRSAKHEDGITLNEFISMSFLEICLSDGANLPSDFVLYICALFLLTSNT